MTTRRFPQRSRNPIRREFATGSGSTGTINTNMVDITIVSELATSADSQFGDVLVVGLALVDAADEGGIHQAVFWVGRTSTEPSPQDTKVRTRQYSANQQGLPFVLRIRGLRVDPGMQLHMITQPIAETLGTITHQDLVSVKWSYRELRQG